MPAVVEYFERQFQGQVRAGEFAPNPFEELALEHLCGSVLDLGCGLGNLALAAARRGHAVEALDASPTAVAHLPLRARRVDLATEDPAGEHDTIVAIGLLMFIPRERAHEPLGAIGTHVRPAGVAIVNELLEGMTWIEPSEPGRRHWFARRELDRHFANWTLLATRVQQFPAPGGTLKRFSSLVARKPNVPPGEDPVQVMDTG